MIRVKYAKYPKLYELIVNRHTRYNETLRFLDEEEKSGRAFVIRPKDANDIGRIEKDRQKLEALYELGYQDAKECYDRLMTFLNSDI